MNDSKLTIDQINRLSRDAFITQLGSIFEHSPWVAEKAYLAIPYQSIQELHEKMVEIVSNSGYEQQLRLICAHPELAGKASVRSELTHYSQNEQSGAGLDQCSKEEYERLHALNAQYQLKFGFPFILAVKGHNRHSIIENFSQRLLNEKMVEFNECLVQIYRIAKFRLEAIIQ